MKEAFVCKAIHRGSEVYFLWLSDPDTSTPDGVLLDQFGNIPTFESESAARAFAATGQFGLSEEPAHTYDLDGIASWCTTPTASTLDANALLNAWNLFTDISFASTEATNLFNHVQGSDDPLYDKLFWANNLPAITPEAAAFNPEWDATELQRLSWILSAGLSEFIGRLRAAT
jgi:hypothetical protein